VENFFIRGDASEDEKILTQLKIIVFNIPQCIFVSQIWIARDFLLLEAPLWQLFA
jgi:hypothetical protein